MFTYQRCSRGKLQAVILDWSGTTVDYGCVAPAKVFIEVFAEQGVDITLSEARARMGIVKRDHIRALTPPSPGGRGGIGALESLLRDLDRELLAWDRQRHFRRLGRLALQSEVNGMVKAHG